MEIIAEKKKGLLGIYVFALVLSVGLFGGLLIGVCLSKSSQSRTVVIALLAVLGVLLIGACIWIIVGIVRTPKTPILYEKGNLHFADGFVCPVREVTRVDCRCASSENVVYRWGKLTVRVGERTYTYRNIAEVERARDRILELRLAARMKGNTDRPAGHNQTS